MNLEVVSQIAGILSCIFAFFALIGVGITIKKVSKSNQGSVVINGDVAGSVSLSGIIKDIDKENDGQ